MANLGNPQFEGIGAALGTRFDHGGEDVSGPQGDLGPHLGGAEVEEVEKRRLVEHLQDPRLDLARHEQGAKQIPLDLLRAPGGEGDDGARYRDPEIGIEGDHRELPYARAAGASA
ncbi:hypothetical protein D3C86_1338750 [compost metagenome]